MTVLALALLLCAHQVKAALGDTQTQLVSHYGKIQGTPTALTPKDVTVQFKSGGYTIYVTLLSGQSAREIFVRDDKKAFTDNEIQGFLIASMMGSKWQQVRDSPEVTIWVLDSKEGFAAYDKLRSTFTIKTSDMLAFEEAVVKIQAQQVQQPAKTPDPVIDRSLRP